jgi:hypothetical protein
LKSVAQTSRAFTPRPVWQLQLFLLLLLFGALLCILPAAQAQSSMRSICLFNQDYTQSTADLIVKVLGITTGHITRHKVKPPGECRAETPPHW